MEQDSAHMVGASKVSMLKPGEFKIWRMRIKQYIQMIDYALWEVIENSATLPKIQVVEDLDTIRMDDLYNNVKVYEPKVKRMASLNSNTRNMAFLSFTNCSTNGAVNTANGVSTASTQVNIAFSTNIDNLSDVVICAFLSSQPNSPQLAHEDLEQIHPDDIEEMENGHVDYEGQEAEEGPNYALMAYTSLISDSKVSNGSTCSKSFLESVKLLKSQNEQLLKDLKKSELMVLSYKTGLQLVEERLEITRKNEFIYLEDIKIVDNCKKGLGYESYNAVLPPYTGNFIPLKPDLSYTSLDEFAIKPVVENKSGEEETKAVGKNTNALIIEDCVSDDEEKNVTQPKIIKKTVRPSIVKKEFVKPRQQKNC
uniref:Uncharacterized protein n=1 Tax=Tanacetum cinerariifolium TaxID=118510 RepID=A0A6L2P6N4_TANCI|nr:hypothetical protein [Tanacetum cinerariifolium]